MSTPEPITPEPAAAEPVGAPAGSERQPEPLDVDGAGELRYGTVAWSLAFLACLLLRTPLADAGRSWWTQVCAVGTLLGLAGLVFLRRRRAAHAAADH